MTAPIQPAPTTKKGARLILVSNVALVAGIVVVILGLVFASDVVIVVGAALMLVAIVVSFVNARARRRRIAEERKP